MKEEWLFRGALVPINAATTAALVAEIKRLIDVVGGMALAQDELCSSQEPWMYRIWDEKNAQWRLTDDCSWPAEPIYTTPPKRPWVGLTDEDTHAIWNKDFRGWISRDSMEQITLAVASELKEKNT